MTADHILDTIDGALADCEVSRDAMRHIPEEERTEEARPFDATPSWDRILNTVLRAYIEGHDLGRGDAS